MTRIMLIPLLLTLAAAGTSGQSAAPDEEQAIRQTLSRFYEGWNAHDPDMMVAVFADDIDHINVFGEWHKGKAAIRRDLAEIHAGPSQHSQRTPSFEKIRFLTPDAAVTQVASVQTSALSQAGPTLGTPPEAE